MPSPVLRTRILLLSMTWTASAHADEDTASGEEVVVEVPRAVTTASEGSLGREEVEEFPARSADELLQAMPGLHQSAHGGHGKAYQYFIRGFDAVHGTDLAVFLEGIPLNEVSNVHGQGYLDLYFIPTILVERLNFYKGSSRAEVGDFGTAASADFALGLAEEGAQAEMGGGSDRSGSVRLAWRPGGGSSGNFAVAEGEAGLGAGENRTFRHVRLAIGAERWFTRTRVRAFALAHDGDFESPGVLRDDDYEEGKVSFYDAYPESGGGRSSRVLAGGELAHFSHETTWGLLAWGGLRALELRQNFTGYAQDEEHGDGLLQAQRGGNAGLRVRAWRALPPWGGGSNLTSGADLRVDDFQQSERGIVPDGSVWNDRLDDTFLQGSAAVWASLDIEPWPWLDLEPGLRGEAMGIRLEERHEEAGRPVSNDPAFSWAPVLCPKARVVLWPDEGWTGFLTYGRGWRSPEARGIEDGDRAPISTSDTEEIGLRWRKGPSTPPTSPAEVTLVGFHTTVSNEIVFDHTAARFLASGATRRLGGEVVASVTPRAWLRSELEASYADGRYIATGEPLPYAPRWLASLGLYGQRTSGWGRWSAGLRGWYLGPRPLPEGFYSHPSFVIDGTAHAEWRGSHVRGRQTAACQGAWLLDLEVDNLLGTRWRDGEYVYPSWFDRGQPESELPMLHFTAGDPFAIRISLGRRFS